jgi:acyl-CoA hydrolase
MRPSKPVSESKTVISTQMLPSDANPTGNVHGGSILKMVDVAAGVTALRHARENTVTASIDRMDFYNPVYVGNLLTLKASVNYVGKTSMEIGVRIEAENLKTGKITHTGSSYLTYVAIDENGRPTEVPNVVPETPVEKRRWEAGKKRREERLRMIAHSEQ